MSTTRTPSTTRRPAQVAVWVLLAAFIALSAWSLSNPASSPTPTAPSYSLQAPDGTIAPLTAQQSADLYAADAEVRAAGYQGATIKNPNQFTDKKADPSHWLPASRWSGTGLASSKAGMTDIFNGPMAMMAGFMFSFAGMIWSWVFWLLEKALTLDMVSGAAGTINDVAATLGKSMGDSGALAVVVGLMILTVAGAVLRNGKSNGLRIVLGCIIPLAALQLMLGSITPSSQSQNSTVNMLTPAGLSMTGTEVISSAVEKFTQPMSSSASTKMGQAASPCEYYYKTLMETYKQVAKSKNNDFSSTAIVLMSDLWKISFVDPLTLAQYGDMTQGRRAVCHHLEWQAGTPVVEQGAIAGVKDRNSPFYGFDTGVNGVSSKGNTPFTKPANEQDAAAAHIFWMACSYDPGKAGASKVQGPWGAPHAKKTDLDSACQQWSRGEWEERGAFHFKNGESVNKHGYPNGTDAYKVIVHNMGQEGKTQRLTQGLGAVLSAGAYGFALTMPAIGCAIATAALALMLALLPLTLLLLAIPSKDGSNKGAGMKLLKLTGSLMLSKAMFLILITVLIQLILIYNTVLGVG